MEISNIEGVQTSDGHWTQYLPTGKYNAQSFMRELFDYHHARGFANPLPVQAPWFPYVPRALEAAANEDAQGAAPASEYARYR